MHHVWFNNESVDHYLKEYSIAIPTTLCCNFQSPCPFVLLEPIRIDCFVNMVNNSGM